MNNKEFIEKLKFADGKNTIYMWGTFGVVLTNAIIDGKARQYPSWYTPARVAKFKSLVGKGYFGFDCIGLMKGILWGWNGNLNSTYGGAKYASNGMPDTNANGYIRTCKEVSTNFSSIEPGEAVWMPGHIGVYIGNGEVIEASPAWANGVQKTKLSARRWEKHGKMPQIEYLKEEVKPIAILNTTANLNLRKGPSTSYTVLTVIPKGADVQVYSKANGWARASYKNITGYCSLSYLKEEMKNGMVIASVLNVRSGAGTSYRVKDQFKYGFVVDILDKVDNWYKIRYGTTVAYVSANYIQLTDADPTPISMKIQGKVVRCTALNIRRSPGGTRVGVYKAGDTVNIIEKTGGWYKTDKGYCSAYYIDLL